MDLGDRAPEAQRNDVYLTLELLESGSVQTAMHVAMLELHKTNTAKIGSKALQDNPGRAPRGIFVEKQRPEYCEEYDKVIKLA